MRKFIIVVIALHLLISCDEDENSLIIEVTTENFDTNIDENPQSNQSLGSIVATTNQGTLSFTIESQEPTGAFQINENTGELFVDDETLFDFELNETINGVVKVSNQNTHEFANVTITLNDILEVIFTTSDFETTIEENPITSQLLGTVDGNSNQGELVFTLLSQNPNGAFLLDIATGDLRVDNTSLFDFEQNPVLTGIVKVENGNLSENVTITVNLIDNSNCVESNQIFQYDLINFAENNFMNISNFLDLTTHEYTFTPSSNKLLCSIGYQSFDETPYLIQIEDNTNSVIIFEQMISFSSTEQDEFELNTAISLLANRNYTIRRIQNEWTYISDVIGFIFEGDNFPVNINEITILSSNFYGTGGPIPNFGIPYITLGFEQ